MVIDDIDADPIVDVTGTNGERQVEAEVARARGRKPPVTAEGCIRVLDELLASLDRDMPNCGEGALADEVCTLRDRVGAAAGRLRQSMMTDGGQGRGGTVRRSEGHRAEGESGTPATQSNNDDNDEGAIEELCSDIMEFEAKTTA